MTWPARPGSTRGQDRRPQMSRPVHRQRRTVHHRQVIAKIRPDLLHQRLRLSVGPDRHQGRGALPAHPLHAERIPGQFRCPPDPLHDLTAQVKITEQVRDRRRSRVRLSQQPEQRRPVFLTGRMHGGPKLIEQPRKLRADLHVPGGLPQSGNPPHIRRQLSKGPRGHALVGQVERIHAAPDRRDRLMQPPGLPARIVIRLPRHARHVNPKGAGHRADQRWAGRRSPGLDLGQQAVRHVGALREFTSRPPACLADHRDPGADPVLVSHRSHISGLSSDLKFHREYPVPCCSVATATCNRKTP